MTERAELAGNGPTYVSPDSNHGGHAMAGGRGSPGVSMDHVSLIVLSRVVLGGVTWPMIVSPGPAVTSGRMRLGVGGRLAWLAPASYGRLCVCIR